MTKTLSLILLNQAPDYFFDQEKWQQFVMLCQSHETAVNILTSPMPRIRSLDISPFPYRHNQPDEQDQINKLREDILADFKAKLSDGLITATGIQPPSLKPVEIPAFIWKAHPMTFNFNQNTAKGGKYEFIEIGLLPSKNVSPPKQTLIQDCADWLSAARLKNGDSTKIELYDRAYQKFGKVLSKRGFDEAYQMVYERSRGRPRKPRK